ncbi:hypothetical protein ACQEVM_19895 [Streptomyces sp. CA-243310]|uniref:hypothetical protein n=1 Tax=Streptomyces sp. CA-243310 TaxID=3240056 RepID=UPI003D910A47
MSAQPVHPHGPRRIPRHAEGIAAALSGEYRREFHAELLVAAPDEAKGVLLRWWGRATLAADADRGPRVAGALAGHTPTVSVGEMIERRRAAGLPV